MSLLEVESLTVRYGQASALTDVSLALQPKGALAILGANGAGKSTLAKAICGMTPSVSGEVRFDGEVISGLSAHGISRRGVAYLPEGRGVFHGLSVHDNLRVMLRSVGRAELPAALDRAYEFFPALAQRRQLQAGSLSGGEQQMLALARILVNVPRVVIADEPSLGLAPKPIELVFQTLESARAAGAAVVLIEQYVRRALAFCTDVIILRRGAIAWQGTAQDAGDEVLSAYLGTNPDTEE